MEWLRRKDNPYFAKAIVNRIWAHYFQSGIVNSPDDLNLANAPSNSELLDYLANGFIGNHYDLKWLHRTILNTATYQRGWQTNESNALDRRNFSHALLRRLPAETAYDALRIALSDSKQAKALCNVESERAMTIAGASAQTKGGRNALSNYALTVFGRSLRESNCDCDKSSDPSLLQTVFIRNDADVLKAMSDEHSWLSQVAREYHLPSPLRIGLAPVSPKMDEKRDVRTAEDLDRDVRKFRTQLENLIAKEDNEKAIKRVNSELALAENPTNGISDVLWALINSKEFILNH